MIYWQIFMAFFVPNIVGYGGGPAIIPLIEHEVVNRYGWMGVEEFAEVLALGNALPGPIATKMAGLIGYEMGGVLGSILGLTATVLPSLLLMLMLLGILYRYRNSPKVQMLSKIVRPTIAVLLGAMTWRFFSNSYNSSGLLHTVLLLAASYYLIQKKKIHPAFVIMASLVYGILFLSP